MRIARLSLAAAIAASALAFVPGANAVERLLCRRTAYLYVDDMRIEYTEYYRC